MLQLFEMFDPTVLALFGVVDACVGLVVGLLLVVVGFVTVRSASPNAGYLVGGAGALQLLTYCCGSWQEPAMVWLEMYELTESLGGISSAAALLFHLASAALMIVGAVLLARELTARREASGASPQGGA